MRVERYRQFRPALLTTDPDHPAYQVTFWKPAVNPTREYAGDGEVYTVATDPSDSRLDMFELPERLKAWRRDFDRIADSDVRDVGLKTRVALA